jgi:hypothetical protein
MRALLVYESMYGNTHAVADAISQGLAGQGVEVTLEPASSGYNGKAGGVDLLIVGGPTHARGMTRPNTRRSAIDTAHMRSGLTIDLSAEGPGVREWLDSMSRLEVAAAAFDTRIDAPPFLTGRAAKSIDARLRALGCRRAAQPESFLVTIKNHLVDGELDRAREWGSMLAGQLVPSR